MENHNCGHSYSECLSRPTKWKNDFKASTISSQVIELVFFFLTITFHTIYSYQFSHHGNSLRNPLSPTSLCFQNSIYTTTRYCPFFYTTKSQHESQKVTAIICKWKFLLVKSGRSLIGWMRLECKMMTQKSKDSRQVGKKMVSKT